MKIFAAIMIIICLIISVLSYPLFEPFSKEALIDYMIEFVPFMFITILSFIYVYKSKLIERDE